MIARATLAVALEAQSYSWRSFTDSAGSSWLVIAGSEETHQEDYHELGN